MRAQESQPEAGVYTSFDGYQFREADPVHARRRMRRDDPTKPRRYGYGLHARVALVAAEDRRVVPHCPQFAGFVQIVVGLAKALGGAKAMHLDTYTRALAAHLPGRWGGDADIRTAQRYLRQGADEGYWMLQRGKRRGDPFRLTLTSKGLSPPYYAPKHIRAVELAKAPGAPEEVYEAARLLEAYRFVFERDQRNARKNPNWRKPGRCDQKTTSASPISVSSSPTLPIPQPFVRGSEQTRGREGAEKRAREAREREEAAKAAKKPPANQAKPHPAPQSAAAQEGGSVRKGYVTTAEGVAGELERFEGAASRLGLRQAYQVQHQYLKADTVKEIQRRHPELDPWASREHQPTEGIYVSSKVRFPDPEPPDVPLLPPVQIGAASPTEVLMGKRYLERRLKKGETLGAIWRHLSDRATMIVCLEAWWWWKRELTKTY